jgi:hypothetical protein
MKSKKLVIGSATSVATIVGLASAAGAIGSTIGGSSGVPTPVTITVAPGASSVVVPVEFSGVNGNGQTTLYVDLCQTTKAADPAFSVTDPAYCEPLSGGQSAPLSVASGTYNWLMEAIVNPTVNGNFAPFVCTYPGAPVIDPAYTNDDTCFVRVTQFQQTNEAEATYIPITFALGQGVTTTTTTTSSTSTSSTSSTSSTTVADSSTTTVVVPQLPGAGDFDSPGMLLGLGALTAAGGAYFISRRRAASI